MKENKEENVFSSLIKLDKSISHFLSSSVSKKSAFGHYRAHMKALEYSCHGVFWISGSIIGLWFAKTPQSETFLFNMLLALFLDIICVALLKAAIHRKRPDNNEDDMFLTLSIDKMSCPSGHTSRAVLLSCILVVCSPNVLHIFHPLIWLWCLCTCASRVLMGRHHAGDVLVGAVLGCIEYKVMDYLWAGPETAKWYLDIFRDSNSLVEEL